MTIKERDALNNAGLPDLAQKNELSKGDIKRISEKIKEFDSYYLKGWKTSETRKKLVEMVNDFIIIFRVFSIQLIK